MYKELMCSVERGFNLLLGGCTLEREDVANPYFSCCCFARSKVTDGFKPILKLFTLGVAGQKYHSLKDLGFVGDLT